MATRRQIISALVSLPAVMLAGCGNGSGGSATACSPIRITDGHDCALCGMTITHHPGPKAQACMRDGRVLPFCSVEDMLSWSWQPESQPNIRALYVHDLSLTDWDGPADDAYIEADRALYVVGHERRGSMGRPPAPFSDRADAEAFIAEHGGKLMAYRDLGWESVGASRTHQGH